MARKNPPPVPAVSTQSYSQVRSWNWRPGGASSRGQPLGSPASVSSSAHLASPGTPKLRIGGSSMPAQVSAIPAAAAPARSTGPSGGSATTSRCLAERTPARASASSAQVTGIGAGARSHSSGWPSRSSTRTSWGVMPHSQSGTAR